MPEHIGREGHLITEVSAVAPPLMSRSTRTHTYFQKEIKTCPLTHLDQGQRAQQTKAKISNVMATPTVHRQPPPRRKPQPSLGRELCNPCCSTVRSHKITHYHLGVPQMGEMGITCSFTLGVADDFEEIQAAVCPVHVVRTYTDRTMGFQEERSAACLLN